MAKRDVGLRAQPALRILMESANRFGLSLDDPHWRKIRVYLELLLLWNRRTALVSQADPVVIACKHFADSLFAASVCASNDRIIDLGTGAGFPGLVIAIVHPSSHVSLIDSRRRKISFLTEVISTAGVSNARALEGRFESLCSQPDHRERYTLAISRALSNLAEFLRNTRGFLLSNGRAIAMKGPAYQDELIDFDPEDEGFAPARVVPYALPDSSERFLLEFRRIR